MNQVLVPLNLNDSGILFICRLLLYDTIIINGSNDDDDNDDDDDDDND